MNLECGLDNQWLHAAVLFSVLAIEAWLGKTVKTKSSSTLELIFRLTVALFARLLRKGAKDGSGSKSETVASGEK